MSDSEDDLPLARMYGQTQDGSDSSEMPDWIRNHQTPIKLDVSSGDEDEVQAPEQAAAGPSSSQPAAAAAAASTAGPSKGAAAGRPGPAALPAAAGPTAAAVVGSHRSELQLILPEQLQRNKVLVELEAAAHGATDLSGDAGAVGRLLLPKGAAEGGSQPQQLTNFLLDLKGMLYSITVIPLAGTAMVVNIGPGDARVESIMNDFVRLGEESSYLDSGMLVEGGGAGGMGELLGSDDEHYLPDVAAVAGASQPDKAGGKAKPRKKAGGGGKGGSGGGSLKARAGGVAKKAAGSSRKSAGAGSAKKKTAAGSRSKPAASKKAGSTAKKAAGSAAKPAAAAATKPKAKKSKKPADSEEEDAGMTSDESEPDWSGGSD